MQPDALAPRTRTSAPSAARDGAGQRRLRRGIRGRDESFDLIMMAGAARHVPYGGGARPARSRAPRVPGDTFGRRPWTPVGLPAAGLLRTSLRALPFMRRLAAWLRLWFTF